MMHFNKTEQVAQACFEIRVIEVGIGVKNNSSVDFDILGFFTYLNMFLRHIILHFLPSVISKTIGIGNFKGQFSKSYFQKNRLHYRLSYTQMVISQKVGEVY